MQLVAVLALAFLLLSGAADKTSINDTVSNLLKKRPSTKVVKALLLASNLSDYVDESEFDDLHEFLHYIATYNRQYRNLAEVRQKFKAVQRALKFIKMLNEKNPLAKFGLTERSDRPRTHRQRHHDMNLTARTRSPLPEFPNNSTPETYNWRDHEGVTSVKKQGDCESSYVFAAVAAVESQWLIYKKDYWDLSENQVLSCTYNNPEYKSCKGCLGGLASDALSYIKARGITEESESGYNDHFLPPVCSKGPVVATINATKSWQNVDEEKLRSVVYNIGPVVVTVQADVLEFYKQGIISIQLTDLVPNHSLLLVGYGEENGRKYWILKTSWGAHYGEDGYVRIERGFNVLGLARQVDAAIVVAKGIEPVPFGFPI
ncbi:unnamed protein product [Bursaphelenchus xylophilus]|uniref:(pine wood nematode) hypothetical protein n=1 Tax=Bursaphelenchus xylophilus TaxID=6326 RepID=A0A7I8X652_BURXY|nr:unnamed protein product [Bursaphelenchus xylophilus]CAG9122311.1 unnamed protein product [Bursaphelenchus xylophilus]